MSKSIKHANTISYAVFCLKKKNKKIDKVILEISTDRSYTRQTKESIVIITSV